jgi:hypothetical protein
MIALQPVADLRYSVLVHTRAGADRLHDYSTDEPLAPGAVLRLAGRSWLVERVEPQEGGAPARAVARPARYRVRLHHPDGRDEVGAFRRFRADAPRLGHSFTTLVDGQQASWEVVDERLAVDDADEPYLDLRAERDYAELEGDVPDHELEHALAARGATSSDAGALLARAAERGLSAELVALEPGEEPDWAEAQRYVDALVIEEIEDDLLELCGVDPGRDRHETWLATVQERLRSDLERLRADIEGDHDEIEEWDFEGGRVLATIGDADDEADPDRGHGWMCRLVDAGVLGVAGFERVRKAELDLAG